ncbi:tRNA(Ile)-lysidine synthase [Azonexus fungiphilus]|uniref:tRNA(Ile)-lysidine synthase n=1 Tax=Azonexus fungiphilus TaxID=146940 RepID=A0A495VLC2_9RHOO|nr:tRNA lysidine(34) synthetase TilS [Azonexus fungiphilus]RKT50042.1 tRNA(Ile)-lysidine synthase [Azonexus fungiphilus]
MAGSRNRLPDPAARVGAFVAARLAGSGPVWLALSGGRDSVVLLHLLAGELVPGRLRAIHVDHGLSPNAGAWADFCRSTCAALAVPLQVVPVHVERSSAQGLEAAARAARYAAFAAHLPPAADLLLAQHRGDQAETLLFNLLRGSGLAGAAAMREVRTQAGLRLLRPLLDVPRAAIDAYAAAHGLTWIDDESNDDRRFSRNFLRHEVLTVIAARFPGVEANLAQAAGHFGEAVDLLDEVAASDWAAVRVGDAAALDGLRRLSFARLKNLLRWRLRQLGWQPPVAARLDEFARQLLVAAPDRHPELRLPAGRMRLTRGRLHWLLSE